MNKVRQRQIVWWVIVGYLALVVFLLLGFIASKARAGEIIYMPSIAHIGGSYFVDYYGEGDPENGRAQLNEYTLNDQPHLLAYRHQGFVVGVYKNSYHQGTALAGWGWGPDLPGRFQPRVTGLLLYGYSECWPGNRHTLCADMNKPGLLPIWQPSNPLDPSLLFTIALELKIRLEHGYNLNPMLLGDGFGLGVSYEF